MDVTKRLTSKAGRGTSGDGSGGAPPPRSPLARSNPFARAVVRSWRRLTCGGKPTLIACSGGADSSALVLALATTSVELVVAHVVHDLRPRAEAERDRNAVRDLAERLGLVFVDAEVHTREHAGNPEGVARRLRYAALARLAEERGLDYVATAHHADDQLESVVMALLRGAGPRGMRGVAASRSLASGVTLVRPMLDVSREQAVAACRSAGVEWVEDATNRNTDRLRAALRHGPLKDIAALRPGIAQRASRAARLMADADAMVRERAAIVFGEGHQWGRKKLADERQLVIAEGLRMAASKLTRGARMDRITAKQLDPVIVAIGDKSTQPRTFVWSGKLRVIVSAKLVRMEVESE